MQRYVLGQAPGIDQLRLEEASETELGMDGVRVEMRAWSLNYRDLMVVKGTYGGRYQPGLIPLSDGVGHVIEVGSTVTRFKVGDRVASCFFRDWIEGPLTPVKAKTALGGGVPGVLADRVVLPEHGLVHVPESLSDLEAATLPCAGVTAWNALIDTAVLRPGQTVLLQGTGGVSMQALGIAKAAGARVMITSSSNEKLERAKQLGAEATVNYREQPEWDRAAYEWTGGRGVDVVVEVGGADTLPKSLRSLTYGGNIAVIGVLTGANPEMPLPYLFSKNARMTGIYVGSRLQFEAMNRAIEQNKIRPVIDRVFEFEEAADAFRHMESGSHFGKIVISRKGPEAK
ncbi:zinc-dependent alcohol dehydrogenase family protein [Fimbriimonas ginsengisoli]|uniref:Alcohol dehydrogenase n=1 Tax=Fimbriimonas ginsengisoli Gsoil 348 TaxID=661478 RepID=A0A068NR49_FIMGI|nr:NAD(P)-dependent alcohol dehydrogenase [Fimbriimonas ginsengisoli]AIE85235.1 alcohol dehydrogenase [Fimbriimonas ginsengisoli Gsoil 348]